MGILESSTLSLTNLEPTTWTLSGGTIPSSTTLGSTTTVALATTLDLDENGNRYVNPKKLRRLLGTTAATTTISSSMNMKSAFAAEYHEQAVALGITAEQEIAVNQERNVEEWFESLSDEEQIQLLMNIDQKEQTLKSNSSVEKAAVKQR